MALQLAVWATGDPGGTVCGPRERKAEKRQLMQANPMAAMAGENGHVAMHWVDGDVASSTASPARARGIRLENPRPGAGC